MHIFLDEAGTFAISPNANSWCVVAAIAMPESAYRNAKEVLRRFKVSLGIPATREIKRRDLTESQYFALLEPLARLPAVGIAVATDAGRNGTSQNHREMQARKIEDQAPEMIYPEGQQMLRDLAADVRKLSLQNYVELNCRTYLVHDVIQLATLYFVQRFPGCLSAYRWQFDRKDVERNHFERTLSYMVGPLLQSMSLPEPGIRLEGADYSRFERFDMKGVPPEWLPKRPPDERRSAYTNVGKIWNEHLAFVDSAACPGVQLADLLVSGIRALLRRDFSDNNRAADLIGACLVGRDKKTQGMRFVAIGDEAIEEGLDPVLTALVRRAHKASKGMLISR